MLTTLHHYTKLNENTFVIYFMHSVMHNHMIKPVSIDKTPLEKQFGYDIVAPFDSSLFYFQIKVCSINDYFIIPVQQLSALRTLNLSNPFCFFVLSPYRTPNEIIRNSDNILNEQMILFPNSNKFNSQKLQKNIYIRYDRIFPDPPENFFDQPHSFKELISKLKGKNLGLSIKKEQKVLNVLITRVKNFAEDIADIEKEKKHFLNRAFRANSLFLFITDKTNN